MILTPFFVAFALIQLASSLPQNKGLEIRHKGAKGKGQGQTSGQVQGQTQPQGQNQASNKVQNGKALYFITNDAENAVVAMAINPDGTLGKGTMTKTGGKGSNSIDGMTGKPATPDALVGQSALTLAGNNLFAVNAGSNSVTQMRISAGNACQLQVVGKPMPLPGTFPNTVAASAKNNLVCAGMTGSKAGISCAKFNEQQGIGKFDALRAFDIGQSDPPVGPTNTVSQSFFSTDESMLFTTVKGDPMKNNTGFLSAIPVQNGAAGDASQEKRSSPAGTAVLFGSVPMQNNQIFATDASFGAGILSTDKAGTAQLIANQTLDGQKATCWATISPATGNAFVTDVGVNRVVEMSTKDASIVGVTDLSKDAQSAADPGLIDLKAAGNMVYALSPGNGTSQPAISVLNVGGGPGKAKLVQHAQLGSMGVTGNAQGMAVLV